LRPYVWYEPRVHFFYTFGNIYLKIRRRFYLAKRAGGKGQSSKFYNIYGKVVKPTDPNGFKGGQGWTAPKPQIGSMLSLGIMKQNKNAGGNNVCQPGPI